MPAFPPTPKYLTAISVDLAGLVPDASLPEPLPHGLRSRDFVRTVEDVQDLIQELNSLLATKSYNRLELLLDPAGYSGLISRTVADRLARASKSLVVNRHHNGYPDLIPAGRYPNDAVAKSDEGFEIKASRYASSWQSHGPRDGWFGVVQFAFDGRDTVPPEQRDATTIVAVMAAKLETVDWSWQPARTGAIRSGTASVKPSGMRKLRDGAIWVRPEYRARHDILTLDARLNVQRPLLDTLIQQTMASLGHAVTVDELAAAISTAVHVPEVRLVSAIRTRLRALITSGTVRVLPGRPRRFEV